MLKTILWSILFSFIFSVDYITEIQPIFNNNCGNCRACWDTTVKNVSYKKH